MLRGRARAQRAIVLFILVMTAAMHARAADLLSKAHDRRADVDTIRTLSIEGRLLLQKDRVRLDGAMYCERSIAFAEKGEPRLSIQEASKALALGQLQGNEALTAAASRDLAIAYSYAGDLERARELALHSLSGMPGRLAIIAAPAHKVLGDVAMRQGRAGEALAHYQRARAVASPRFRPLVEMSLVSAYLADGDAAQARALHQTLALPTDEGLRLTYSRVTGNLLLAEGRPQQAIEAFSAALHAAPDADAGYHRVWAHEGIARSLLASKDKDGARAAYARAVNEIETVRARFRSEEFKTGLFASLQQIFERAIELASDAGAQDGGRDAWLLSEASRSRALLDVIRGRVAAQPAAAATPEEVRAMLGANEALAQYHLLDDRLLIWVLRADGMAMHSVQASRAQIETWVRAFRDALQERGWDDDAARALSASLVAPLKLRAGERLLVVPHGALHYLPFQVLRVDGSHLIQAHPLAYMPSASIALRLQQRQAVVRRLIAFGNPANDERLALPGAEREVRRIAALFPDAEIFLRRDASRQRFLEHANQGDVLHVAAHAEVDAVDPLESRILLAPAADSDGRMKAREVYGLSMDGLSLVTLSACESGLGAVLRGDEAMGFSHAFLSAGASALAVSLWPVADESTEQLMTTMYSALNKGADLIDAMRAAQLTVMRAPGYAHPSYWAPFNLVGNWRIRSNCGRGCNPEEAR